VASHRLLRRRTEEQIYSLDIPLSFAALELMDLVNVSHESIPLSGSRLSGVSSGLIEGWQRFIARLVGVSVNPLERTIAIRFKDHESFMATYWSTDRLPEGTNDDFDGLVRLGVGGTLSVDRPNFGYLEQENNVKLEVGQNLEGEFFRRVAVGNEKMNHIGFLAEDATQNPILNNAAKGSETSWTSVPNSGTLDLSTLRLAYPSSVTPRSFRALRANNANDTYRHQTFAVLSADAFRRIYLVKSEENATSIVSWRLQRSTDSKYWNDATPAWEVSAVWNRLPNSYDATNALSTISRHFSRAIDVAANENWTVAFGLEGAALPAGGGEVNVYSISALKGYLVYSEVPTDAAAVSTTADTVKRVKTSGAQLVSALRGALTFELDPIQLGTDLKDGDELCLYYWQYGSTAGQDYDAIIYEKQAAETVRFSFVRYIAGVLDARAFYAISTTPGTVHSVTAVWTDDTNGELDEAVRLVRIFVDGVKGTDDFASANHSAAEAHTELWFGCAPGATGYRRAMNYLRYPRFWLRPFSSEEAI